VPNPAPAFARVGAVASGVGTTIVPALPVGWVAGNYWLLPTQFSNGANGGTIATPAGWTKLAGPVGTYSSNFSFFYLFGKLATVGDTAPTLTETGGTMQGFQGVILEYSGVGIVSPIDGAFQSAQRAGGVNPLSVPIAPYTTTQPNDLVVQFAATTNDNTFHASPAGVSGYSDYRVNDFESGAAGCDLAVVDAAFATPQTIPTAPVWTRFGTVATTLVGAIALRNVPTPPKASGAVAGGLHRLMLRKREEG